MKLHTIKKIKILLNIYKNIIISKILGHVFSIRAKSISALIRVRNGENFLYQSIESIIEVCDEIVIVNNISSDSTAQIIEKLVDKYPHKIVSYEYYHDVCKVGEDSYNLYRDDPNSPRLTHNYYNWCMQKCTKRFILKWDDDMIATPNLINKIKKFKFSTYLQYNFGGANISPNKKSFLKWNAGTEPRIFPKFYSSFEYCDYTFVDGNHGGQFIKLWVPDKNIWNDSELQYAHLKYCKKDPYLNQSKLFIESLSSKLEVSSELDEVFSKIVNNIFKQRQHQNYDE